MPLFPRFNGVHRHPVFLGKVLVFHAFDVILIRLNVLFGHLHSPPPPSDSCCFGKDIPSKPPPCSSL
ncbi:hypothetical protein EH5_01140 [Bacillus subtilis]|nr:hypothetical protein EH5_01140 [Bacillus subtilis]